MEIRILNEEEWISAAGLSRYVFDTCLRNRMEFVQTIVFVEEYLYLENLRRMCAEGKLILWGAFYENQMIGVSGLQSDGMITMLYVLPQFHNRGVGQNMLLAMREFAKDRYGFNKVVLNATPSYTSFYFLKQGFCHQNPKQSLRVPFISMYAQSKEIETYRKEKISGKTIVFAILACFGVATLAGCLYMLGYMV